MSKNSLAENPSVIHPAENLRFLEQGLSETSTFTLHDNVLVVINNTRNGSKFHKFEVLEGENDTVLLGESEEINTDIEASPEVLALYKEYMASIDGLSFLETGEGIPADMKERLMRFMNVSDADVNSAGGDLTASLVEYSMRALGYSKTTDIVLLPKKLVPIARMHVQMLAKNRPGYYVSPENIVGFTRSGSNHIDLTNEAVNVIKTRKGFSWYIPFLFKNDLHIKSLIDHTDLKGKVHVAARTADDIEKMLNTPLESQENDEAGLSPTETSINIYEARRRIEDKVYFLENAPKHGISVPEGSTITYNQEGEDAPELSAREIIIQKVLPAYKELFSFYSSDEVMNLDREFALKEPFSASGNGIYKFSGLEELSTLLKPDDQKSERDKQKAKDVRIMLEKNNRIRIEAWEDSETIVAAPGVAGYIHAGNNGEPIINISATSDQIMDGHEYAGSHGNSQFFTKEAYEQVIKAAHMAFKEGYTGPFSVDMLVLLVNGKLEYRVNEINARQTGQFTGASFAYNHGTLENNIVSDEEALTKAQEIVEYRKQKKALQEQLTETFIDEKREEIQAALDSLRPPTHLHDKQWRVENFKVPKDIISEVNSQVNAVLPKEDIEAVNTNEEYEYGVLIGTERAYVINKKILALCEEISAEVGTVLAKELGQDKEELQDTFRLAPVNIFPKFNCENGELETYKIQMHLSTHHAHTLDKAGYDMDSIISKLKEKIANMSIEAELEPYAKVA